MSKEKLLDLDLSWGEESSLVRTVSRGILCNRFEQKWGEIRKLSEEKEENEFKKFVRNLKDCDHFGGVLHRNTFRINHKIALVCLGFFGPHEAHSPSYHVSITVEDFKKGKTLHTMDVHNVRTQTGKMFYVHFDNAVPLEANTFYNIGFQLEGPKTGILDPDKVISEWIGFESGSRLEFNFLRGSLQMPEIKYILL